MRTETVIPTLEDLKTGASEVAEMARDISSRAGRKLDTAYNNARRSMRHFKVAAEDAVEDTRREIKDNPLTAVTLAAAGAFVIGMAAGWLASRRRS